jgi:filamentous hemagglutinin family protein
MKNTAIVVSISVGITLTPCLAGVTTDGTVGPALHLAGPNFHIGQNLGTLRGDNLFHSFSHFNLNQSQSATFTGDSAIKNVISRVTGGELSSIDGTLKSDIGHAAFYFINPAGIVFGQHAHVDVPGAFYASTAGELQFADGERFSAVHPHGNSLSMAAPSAFGFVGKQTGTMAINGANLVFKSGTTVQLSAVHINMDKAKLTGDGIDLQLVAAGNAKQGVGITALPNHALQGNISLKNTALDASGNGKGRIAVRAGDVTAKDSDVYADNKGNVDMSANQGIDMQVDKLRLDNTLITSDTTGAGNAGTVKISAQKELAITNGGLISSSAFAKGNAGNTDVKAGTIRIDGQGAKVFTGITSSAYPNSSGNAGKLTVTAQNQLAILNGGEIQSSTFAKGTAGNIDVKVGALRIDEQDAKIPTGIFSDSGSNSIGHAGTVSIRVKDELAINNGGQIRSNTFATGDAGHVDVNAGNIRIDGQGSEHPTGIASDANSNSSGNAGTVKVTAKDELALINDGRISSSTFATGNAGHVDIEAGNIRIDGKGSEHATGIASDTFAKGNAGPVDVDAGNIRIDGQGSESFTGITSGSQSNSSGNAGPVTIVVKDELVLVNNGQIDSSTLTRGNAGPVTVSAGTIRIDGAKNPKFITGVLSGSLQNATGSPGPVNVTATKALSMNAGEISIRSDDFTKYSTQTGAKPITITITAPHIELKNNSLITAESFGKIPANPVTINTSQLSLDNSAVRTSANQGDGGPITINSQDWARLHNSQVTTSVASKENGNGGDITINADVLVMDTGFIQANTNAKNASGGKINLNAKQLVVSSANLQKGGNTPLAFIPNSGNNVIQAAAPDGINGNITISAPQLNIVGALAGLNTPQLDLNRVGHDPCSSTARHSTIKNLGKGGVPMFNKGQDGYTIDRLLAKTPTRQTQTTHAINHNCQPKHNHAQPALTNKPG